MENITRQSPISFNIPPAKTREFDKWEIAAQYPNEGEGLSIVDLSHLSKWDVQDAAISDIKPLEIGIPERPGHCVFEKGALISRMNRTQAMVWRLQDNDITMPDEPAYTDVTEAWALFGLSGKNLSAFFERITPLDIMNPANQPPFLIQGPVLHIRCLVAIIGAEGGLLACTRGYGQSMADALLEEGKPFGIRPTGENGFRQWINQNIK